MPEDLKKFTPPKLPQKIPYGRNFGVAVVVAAVPYAYDKLAYKAKKYATRILKKFR